MKSIEVQPKLAAPYPLLVGLGARAELTRLLTEHSYSKVLVLTEKVLEEQWFDRMPEEIQSAPRYLIEAGEHSKSIESAGEVWKFLLANGADRKSVLVSIGGGMVTDLGGFVASTFMRGISALHVPTTLLAQVDASIGGKTGVNFEGTKNIIGAFHHPDAVVIDVEFLKTLPPRDFAAGMAEVLKHGLIRDADYFKRCEVFATADQLIGEELVEIIEQSCLIKREIVQKDEQEDGVRKLLNFGHTFGHAVESLSHTSGTPLLHGEAISIGMLGEAIISARLGLCSEEVVENVRRGLRAWSLPTKFPEPYDVKDLCFQLKRDKKNVSGVISWTLLTAIGEATVDRTIDDTAKEALLIEDCCRELS